MKQLLLITVLVVVMTTKLLAQNSKAIEVTGQTNAQIKFKNNQFKIVAHENVDLNLKFDIKKEQKLNVIIQDRKNNIVYKRELQKEGENKIDFSMEENDQYLVKIEDTKPTNIVVFVTENN